MLSLFGAFFCMTGKPQISPQKWEQMRQSYLTGNVTLKELSQLYSVGHSTLRRRASANDWFTHKRSQRLLIESEARNNLSERLLEQVAKLQSSAPRCIPMPAGKHYDTLIKLLQLQMKLKLKKFDQTVPEEQEPPQPSKVVPLHQTRRPPAARPMRSHSF
jgi:hypothetical protein